MPIYELINPSDPYTFEAPNIEVAGVVAFLLSEGLGARRVDTDSGDESTPVLFGWEQWLTEHGVLTDGKLTDWIDRHCTEVADALDSFVIGSYATRQDVLDMLAELPEEKREAWRARRQERHRSSLNRIGETAYELAEQLRADLVARVSSAGTRRRR